jgi:hypothetical protein
MAQQFGTAHCRQCGKVFLQTYICCPNCGWSSSSAQTPTPATLASPMAEPFVCPVCHSGGVQALSAIGHSGKFSAFDSNLNTAVGSSNLAVLLGPPRDPGPMIKAAIAGFIGQCVLIPFMLSTVRWNEVMPVFLGFFAVLDVLCVWAMTKLLRESEAYPSRIAIWQRLLYCHRCDTVYDPMTSRSAKSVQMHSLL